MPRVLNCDLLHYLQPRLSNLANGDFEGGSVGWTEFSSNGYDLILSSGNMSATPRSGNWAVWLGGAINEISYVKQQVTVPSGSPYLTYWHWIGSEDVCGYDFGGVIVNGGTVVDVYNLCEAANTGGWVKHVVNLSAYAGQSVSIQIQAETDSSLNSNLFVDDVSFQSSASLLAKTKLQTPSHFDIENEIPKPAAIMMQGVLGRKTSPEFLLRPNDFKTR